MSQENVELVRGFYPPANMDLVRLVRSESAGTRLIDALAPVFHADCECLIRGRPEGELRYVGPDGYSRFLMDWLAPWASYRAEIEEVVDLGDRVLVLLTAFGRLRGSTAEVKNTPVEIWAVRDGKMARVEAYADRHDALKAVGLEE